MAESAKALLILILTGLVSACQAGPTPATPVLKPVLQPLQMVAGLDSDALAGQLRQEGIQLQALLPQKRLFTLQAPSQEWARRLAARPGVRFVEAVASYHLPAHENLAPPGPDFQLLDFRPDDPEYRFQWNMRSIGMEKAWELTRSAAEVTVAVIDSGVDPDHPELATYLLPLEDIWGEFAGSDRLANRLTGDVIDYAGRDGNGHGTHVTGVIAAVLNNGEGVAGIAGGGVKVLPIKVTNLTGATNSVLLVAGLRRAIDRGAQVINMSIGAISAAEQVNSQALTEAVQLAHARGIVVVAASGNESQRASGQISGVTVPAAYADVIAVGACNEAGGVADYSNGGPEVDLLAPGGDSDNLVLSTWPTYPTLENLQRRVRSLDYAMASGTSMASPHVSAVAALLLAREPQLSPEQVRARLVATAEDVGQPGYDEDSGYGRLNAFKALQASGDDARF
ncbi:MAG: S8 family serine peptidase [Candidatus Sericytochromatia bacterium]